MKFIYYISLLLMTNALFASDEEFINTPTLKVFAVSAEVVNSLKENKKRELKNQGQSILNEKCYVDTNYYPPTHACEIIFN